MTRHEDESRRVAASSRWGLSIASDSLLVAAGTAVAQVLTAVALVLAARSVRPEDFGSVAAALSLVPVVTQGLDWGSQANLTRRLSAGRADGSYYRAWLVRRGSVFVTAAVAVAALVLVLGVPPAVGVGSALYLCALGIVQPARVWPQVQRRFGVIAAGKVIGRGTTLGVTSVPLMLAGSPLSAAAVLPLAMAVGSVVETAFLARTWPASHADHVSMRAMWHGGGRIGLASMLGMAQQLDTAIVAGVAGAAQAGVYGAVSRWVAPLMLPSLAVGEVLYPRLAASRSRGVVRTAAAGAAPALLLSVVGAVVVAVAADPLTSALLGPAYEGSGTVLAVLAVGTIPLMFAAPVFTLLVARSHDRGALVSRAVGSGASLLLLPLLASTGGATGAAVAVGVGNLLFLITCVALAARAVRGVDARSTGHARPI